MMRRFPACGLPASTCAALTAFICLTSTPAHSQPGASRETFFREAKDAGAGLPSDRIYPRGQRFPVSFFSVGGHAQGPDGWVPLSDSDVQAAMKRAAEDGFTMFGPQYEINDRVLDDAAQHGVFAVYMVEGGWKKDELKQVEPEDIVSTIRQRVEEALAHPHADRIAWWYLQPEELRFWRAHEYRYLKLATETIRATDPLKRPVWMYDPGHRAAAGLAKTAAYLDIVGKGMYTNYSGQVHERVWCRWTIEQEIEAINMARQADQGAVRAQPAAEEARNAARERSESTQRPDDLHRIPIAVPEMFRHPGNFVEDYAEDEKAAVRAIERWARHDAYAALVAGARGMVIFSLRQRRTGELPVTGAIHEAYYRSYARVAQELTGELNLGHAFLFGEPRDDVLVEIIRGPQTLTLEYRNNEPVTYPTIGHANLAVGRDRVLILANSADQPVSAVLSELPYGDDIDVKDLFSNRTFPLGEGEIHLDLEPYEVKALRIAAPESRK